MRYNNAIKKKQYKYYKIIDIYGIYSKPNYRYNNKYIL